MRAGLLHHGFEAMADRTPDALAVVSPTDRLTYGQVERRANHLAARLLGLGARRDTLVAVVAEKGWEQVVATLAVLKAGAAYLPVDADLPRERLWQLLELGGVEVVLTQPGLVDALPWPPGLEIVPVAGEDPAGEVARPEVACAPDALAYVIFTSGSTGLPKGVMIEHRAALNTVADINRRFAVGPGDRVLGLSSLSFDLSVYDIFGTLAAGGALVLPAPSAARDPQAWVELIARERVTVWDTVPALLEMLVSHLEETEGRLGRQLRLAMLSGDWIPLNLPERLWRVAEQARVVSLGGATEASIWSIHYPVEKVDPGWESIPYGRGLENQRWYVLDDDLRPCPPMVTGELYIAGEGLARGYWRDPERTRERFLVHPGGGERLYRTGDLGRLRGDGVIEFLGRKDTQVKIHGFRIELGEIEAVLRRHPAVRQAVAVALGDPRRLDRIAAFVAPLHGAAVEPDEVQAFLSERLPEYMVPSVCRVLDALPLTANGKVDRKALAATVMPGPRAMGGRMPESERERRLAAVLVEVLGLDRVGAREDFFELGGHSLLAAQLAARVRRAFQVDVPLTFVLEHRTVESMALALPARAHSAADGPGPAEPTRTADGRPAPLSFGQEQVWFLNRLLEGGNRAYHFQCTIHFRGHLDAGLLRRALTEVVRRHEILRTTFEELDGEPVQVVHAPFEVELPVEDLRGHPATQRAPEAERRIAQELGTTFDLGRLPLIRWRLFRLAADEWALLEHEHHLVHDGWSVAVLWREVETLYRAWSEGRQARLPELEVQFRDVAAWQRQRYRGPRREASLDWWRRQLHGAGSFDLVDGARRPRFQTFAGAARRVVLPTGLYERLRAFSRSQGTSLFVTMLAAFVALLHRYSGAEDVSVGSWMANRDTLQVERLIGMLVNSVVLRNQVRGEQRLLDLLAAVRATMLEAYAQQEVPFDDVVRALDPPRDPSRNPLVQVFFSFHDSPVPELDWPGVRGTMVERNNGTAKFDLNVIAIPLAEQRHLATVRPGRDDLAMLWEYNSDLLDEATVDRMIEHYQRVLAAIVADPGQRVAELDLLGEQELRRVLVDRNHTARPYPSDATLHGLFEDQARRAPDSVAAVCGQHEVTYQALDGRAERLAHELRRAGVGRGDLVVICMERSIDMLAGLLAILKTGAAYVPLDPEHPPARHRAILEDVRAAAVLTEHVAAARLPHLQGTPAIYADAVPQATGGDQHGAERAAAAGPGDRAYVLHTSGSTGRPKGVEVTHRSVVNLLWAMRGQLGVGERDRLLAVTTLSFDIAALELFLPLLAGARVVIAARETAMDGGRLLGELDRHGITVLQATPITWRLLLEAGWRGGRRLTALCGGERCPRELADALVKRCAAVWNLYGPTETTIWSTSHRVQPGPGPVPIGRPIANTLVYVLDEHLRPLPVGVPGELYIGGDGVALGYLRQPRLTAQRFLPDPFLGSGGARVYRTGDRARWLPDGELEFLGRLDRQVKVRGHRIEVEEVEATLNRHLTVRQSVVDVRAGELPEEQVLVGYVLPVPGQRPDPAALADFVREHLPAYMVPQPIMLIDALPVSPNGKIDLARLPEPEMTLAAAEDAAEDAEPSTELERELLAIWTELLRRDQVGVSDDFFHLGGHSLLALRMVSKIRVRLGIEIPVTVIFEYPTVRELAQLLEASS
jgi:amino acid adenylation domain-containing protein